MFESAIEAASRAARAWSPDRDDPAGGRQCCHLCLHRYRMLAIDGPLHDLPHGVTHAAIVAVDDVIGERIDAAEEQFGWDAWTVLLSEADRELELARRSSTARGALIMTAMEELAQAEPRLAELRRRYTEPAVAGFLAHHRVDEIPASWL